MDKPIIITPADLAPLSRRILNFFIDTVVLCSALTMGLSLLGEYLKQAYGFEGLVIGPPALQNYKFSMANLAISIAYYGLFETLLGQTPGKFVTGTRVVMSNGTKPGNMPILIRSLSRHIPLEFISFLFMPPMGLHDWLSKTLVVDNYAYQRAQQNADKPKKEDNPTEEI